MVKFAILLHTIYKRLCVAVSYPRIDGVFFVPVLCPVQVAVLKESEGVVIATTENTTKSV